MSKSKEVPPTGITAITKHEGFKVKVHSDLRNCVQILTLVDDQWIEFARFWYGPERFWKTNYRRCGGLIFC